MPEEAAFCYILCEKSGLARAIRMWTGSSLAMPALMHRYRAARFVPNAFEALAGLAGIAHSAIARFLKKETGAREVAISLLC